MDVCPICGKKIVRTGKNWVLNDGVLVHKKCPKESKPKLSKEESQDLLSLKDRVSYWLQMKPKGYVVETGLNFMKVNMQIKKLKDQGYSYKDQLYALDVVVEQQGGFYGYTAVVNNIGGIMAKKHERERVLEKSKASKQTTIGFDLGKLLSGEDDW